MHFSVFVFQLRIQSNILVHNHLFFLEYSRNQQLVLVLQSKLTQMARHRDKNIAFFTTKIVFFSNLI